MAPVLIPAIGREIISYLSRPVSLGIRLFANMMAGHTMMAVFAGFTITLGVFGFLPIAINVAMFALEIIVCALQAYVFTILTCTSICATRSTCTLSRVAPRGFASLATLPRKG